MKIEKFCIINVLEEKALKRVKFSKSDVLLIFNDYGASAINLMIQKSILILFTDFTGIEIEIRVLLNYGFYTFLLFILPFLLSWVRVMYFKKMFIVFPIVELPGKKP